MGFSSDLKYALRGMARNPGYTAIAVVVLALGIGANTAIFSVLDAVLLRALPYEKPQQLVMLWMRFTGIGIPKDQNWVSPPEFQDLKRHAKAFSHLAAVAGESFNVATGGTPERIEGALVSTSLFPMLGVRPILGRAFLPEEEQLGRDNVVLLGHGVWQRRFGGDPKLPGSSLRINGRSYVVAGIMPPGFAFPDDAQIWAPLAFTPEQLSANYRGNHGMQVLARVRDGLSMEQARSDLDQISQRIIEGAPDYPYRDFGFRVLMNPLLEETVGDVRPALLILSGAVAFVLLIACTNVANLMLARAASRERELAVRMALGAGRGRLIRQLMTEGMVLAGIGAIAGLLTARWALRGLVAIGEQNFPRLASAQIDLTVLAFTAGAAILTGAAFALGPALHASRSLDPESLKEGGRTTAGGTRQRLRQVLVVLEVTLSLVLLAGAGLLLKSFMLLQRVDPGFKSSNVLTMRVSLPETRYDNEAKVRNFYRNLVSNVSRMPGVQAVGATSAIPLSGQGGSGTTAVDTRAVPPDKASPEAEQRPITPGLLETIGVPLLEGRHFDEHDNETSAPVAIVDETMARTFWPGQSALGKRLKLGGTQSTSSWRTIVGVVRHVRYRTLEAPSRVEVYWPHAQLPNEVMSLAVRTTGEPRAMAEAVRRQVLALDPEQPVYSVRSLDEVVSLSVARRRFSLFVLSVFAGVALLLAAVGIYGVISYSVAQRRQEMGIRLALGATSGNLLRLVLTQSTLLVTTGIVLGILGAVLLTPLMRSLLFNVSATDPLTFGSVALGLLTVGLIAAYIPARRAMTVDPMVALRQE